MHDAQQPPQEWTDALDQAVADVAAGRVVDGSVIHRELKAAIDRMTGDLPPVPERAARVR